MISSCRLCRIGRLYRIVLRRRLPVGLGRGHRMFRILRRYRGHWIVVLRMNFRHMVMRIRRRNYSPRIRGTRRFPLWRFFRTRSWSGIARVGPRRCLTTGAYSNPQKKNQSESNVPHYIFLPFPLWRRNQESIRPLLPVDAQDLRQARGLRCDQALSLVPAGAPVPEPADRSTVPEIEHLPRNLPGASDIASSKLTRK